jgi:hypothetical protein
MTIVPRTACSHPFLAGAQGLELIGQLAGLVNTAVANQDNLEALRDRAAELMVGKKGQSVSV